MKKVITMMKWGAAYPADEFNRLYRALRDTSGDDFEVACVTDDGTGLHPDFRVIPLPEIPVRSEDWTPQMWPKVAVFKEGMFQADELVMFMDVDVIVLDSVMPIFDLAEREGGIWSCPEWDPSPRRYLPKPLQYDRGANTSLFVFKGNSQTQIWDKLVAYGNDAVTTFRNEQKFVTEFSNDMHYVPMPLTVSFKRHCVPLPPLNFFSKFEPPKGTSVVVFQGHPQIFELCGNNRKRWWGQSAKFGIGPVDWVKDYVARYKA